MFLMNTVLQKQCLGCGVLFCTSNLGLLKREKETAPSSSCSVCVLLLCSKRDVQGRVLVLGFVYVSVIFFRKFCASLLLAPLLYDMTV